VQLPLCEQAKIKSTSRIGSTPTPDFLLEPASARKIGLSSSAKLEIYGPCWAAPKPAQRYGYIDMEWKQDNHALVQIPTHPSLI
jgi:hypothetical protein